MSAANSDSCAVKQVNKKLEPLITIPIQGQQRMQAVSLPPQRPSVSQTQNISKLSAQPQHISKPPIMEESVLDTMEAHKVQLNVEVPVDRYQGESRTSQTKYQIVSART